jgi:diguanylate cyclase (GGDEF)-like protein/PAS domain S-box-containing protein
MLRLPYPGRQRPVAHLLTGLVLACLLPGIVGSFGFLLIDYRDERERTSEDMVLVARATTRAIDAHLLHARALAQSLAGAEQPPAGSRDSLSPHTLRAIAAALGSRVTVYGADGAATVPGKPPLPASVLRALQAPGRGRADDPLVVANVGDVASGPGASVAPTVELYVPVTLDHGRAGQVLAIAVPTAQLSALLVERQLPPGWLASLLDRKGVIAARNRAAATWVGQPAVPVLRNAVAGGQVGKVETITRDGVANFAVFVRSERTGYTSVVGVPREQILGPLRNKMAFLAATLGALFILGLLLARAMTRQIAGSIRALVAPASALGAGAPLAMPAVQLAEAVEVGAALERAGALLRQRDAALRAQQDELQQFKFFSEQANEMLLLLDEAGNIRYANRMASRRLGYSNAELLAMTLFEVDLPTTPERLVYVFAQCRHAQPPPFERVYTCKDGSEMPVEITATVLERHGEWLMHVAPRDIGERVRAEQAVRWAARHDALTGLANRATAMQFLAAVLIDARGGRGGALLFIDLDRFKPVNDLYGHEVGDRVLQAVAQRLAACVDQKDLVARIGGDEFVIVLTELADPLEAPATVARAIIDALAEPITLGNIEALLSASIGISRFPEHGATPDVVVHAADMAALHVKHHGRAAFAWYSPDMDAKAQFVLAVERRLQQALEHEGLRLHYQPIVDLASGRMAGVEALVRLEDGAAPPVGPATFVPIAESSGLIIPVGAWVAHEACRQLAAWRARGLDLTIAVNVSAVQFRRANFCQRVRAVMEATGIPPHKLVIELTETAVMENLAEAVEILHNVKALGVRIALDDFGTGYSSLSILSTLPIDKLKIDQSFVRRIESDHASRAVIDAVIALGRSLNLELVAEGIETAAALDYLRERGCHQGQGYYFSRPLARAALEHWWAERSTDRETAWPGAAS